MRHPHLAPLVRMGRGLFMRRNGGRTVRRSTALLTIMLLCLLSPLSPASASLPSPPISTNPNDACSPAETPAPEAYGSGVDGMIKQPDYPSEKLKNTPPQQLTYYDRYGTAGQNWYATDMGCSDAMALMGNSMANTVFTLVRAIDRTTISVYQAAASESLLGWLKKTVDGVISGIGKTFNAQYWAWIVIVGALWLAWWGLLRRRASKVAEGTIWMVVAMVGLTWLITRPADFTTLGTSISEATSAAFNTALPQSDTKGAVCIPPPPGQGSSSTADLDATTRNANGLWVALVCKPWLMGEFGTTDPNSKIVRENADKLLWSQAVDLPETYGGQSLDLGKKADAYKEVANNVKSNYPDVYSTFQGKQWTSRLAVAFGALFAALVAGLLILVIAITLIVVKIAFLLLLVAGPIFLGIGIHPGIGRVIAVRWLELLLSMLLKQAALIGVLALLLWAYGLILGEALPWGLQVLLIALVTFAAFVYRKPFQHLFASVGYSAVGSRAKGEEQLDKSVITARKNTAALATAAVPGAMGYRLARWGRRDPAEIPALADVAAGNGQSTDGADPAGSLTSKARGADGSATSARTGRPRAGAPPLNLPSRGGSPRGGSGSPATSSAGRDTGGGLGSARVPLTKSAEPSRAIEGGRGVPSGGGSGVSRPTSWTGGRTPVAGGSGPGAGGGGNGSAGRGWLAGRSGAGSSGGKGGSAGRGRGLLGGGRSGASRAADSTSGVPKPRPGGEGSPRDSRRPPPLWSGRDRDDRPPMPFWLRPVDRDD